MKRSAYVEQVYPGERTAQALSDEAQRRGVSRSQVCVEALQVYLGIQQEGSLEPPRRMATGKNYGRK